MRRFTGAKRYLEEAIGVVTKEVRVCGRWAARSMNAIRTSTRDERRGDHEHRSSGPEAFDLEWCKGFLAGIFDAEGSHGHVVRICNTDPQIIDWICWSLRRARLSVRR